MQESEEKWQDEQKKFGFNVIYFYWHDLTPWAQTFLVNRTQDPDWVPIYVDDFALIFVKNTAANERWIRQFQIPRSRFRRSE